MNNFAKFQELNFLLTFSTGACGGSTVVIIVAAIVLKHQPVGPAASALRGDDDTVSTLTDFTEE